MIGDENNAEQRRRANGREAGVFVRNRPALPASRPRTCSQSTSPARTNGEMAGARGAATPTSSTRCVCTVLTYRQSRSRRHSASRSQRRKPCAFAAVRGPGKRAAAPAVRVGIRSETSQTLQLTPRAEPRTQRPPSPIGPVCMSHERWAGTRCVAKAFVRRTPHANRARSHGIYAA